MAEHFKTHSYARTNQNESDFVQGLIKDVFINPHYQDGKKVYLKPPLVVSTIGNVDEDLKPLADDREKIQLRDQEKSAHVLAQRKIDITDGLLNLYSSDLWRQSIKMMNQQGLMENVSKITHKLQVLMCVTVYNEGKGLICETIEGIAKNLKNFRKLGICNDQVALVVIFDGIMKVNDNQEENDSVLDFFDEINKQCNFQINTIRKRREMIQDELDKLKKESSNEAARNQGLPLSVPRTSSMIMQTKLMIDAVSEPNQQEQDHLNIFFTVKHQNNKKLSSHCLFLEGFCKQFNPKYLTFIDAGTRPDQYGIVNFFKALESDPKIGGVAGFMDVRYDITCNPSDLFKNMDFDTQNIFSYSEKDKIDENMPHYLKKKAKSKYNCLTCFFCIFLLIGLVFKVFMYILVMIIQIIKNILILIYNLFDIKAAQKFEYTIAHMLDKNQESCLGFLQVLPGAWSCYQYDALSHSSTQNGSIIQQYYLKTIYNPEAVKEDSIVEQNMILAEDRILCLSIYCLKEYDYSLKYIANAKASTDVVETMVEFMKQRRRWINSTWFTLQNILLTYNTQFKLSKHNKSWLSFLAMETNMLIAKAGTYNTYYTLCLYMYLVYFTFYQGFYPLFGQYKYLEPVCILIITLNYLVILVLIFTCQIAQIDESQDKEKLQEKIRREEDKFAENKQQQHNNKEITQVAMKVQIENLINQNKLLMRFNQMKQKIKVLFIVIGSVLGIYGIAIYIIIMFHTVCLLQNQVPYLHIEDYFPYCPKNQLQNDESKSLWGYFMLFLFLTNAIALAWVVLLHIFTMPKEVFYNIIYNFPHYLFFQSFYMIVLVIYSFSKAHDISWGTKNSGDSDVAGQNKERIMKQRNEFFQGYLMKNILFLICLIYLSSIILDHAYVILIIASYSGVLTFTKSFLATWYFISYNLRQCFLCCSSKKKKEQYMKQQKEFLQMFDTHNIQNNQEVQKEILNKNRDLVKQRQYQYYVDGKIEEEQQQLMDRSFNPNDKKEYFDNVQDYFQKENEKKILYNLNEEDKAKIYDSNSHREDQNQRQYTYFVQNKVDCLTITCKSSIHENNYNYSVYEVNSITKFYNMQIKEFENSEENINQSGGFNKFLIENKINDIALTIQLKQHGLLNSTDNLLLGFVGFIAKDSLTQNITKFSPHYFEKSILLSLQGYLIINGQLSQFKMFDFKYEDRITFNIKKDTIEIIANYFQKADESYIYSVNQEKIPWIKNEIEFINFSSTPFTIESNTK